MDKRKGYTIEIDDYIQENGSFNLELRILKNGALNATEPLQIRTSALKAETQLCSQIERFSELLENNRIQSTPV